MEGNGGGGSLVDVADSKVCVWRKGRSVKWLRGVGRTKDVTKVGGGMDRLKRSIEVMYTLCFRKDLILIINPTILCTYHTLESMRVSRVLISNIEVGNIFQDE